MSAETLREAAALMRERAHSATPGPWVTHSRSTQRGRAVINPETREDICRAYATSPRETENAAFIACWNPLVALSVADWLDAEAATLENFEPLLHLVNLAYEQAGAPKAYLQFGRKEDGEIQMRSDTSPAALAVAVAYLGGDA